MTLTMRDGDDPMEQSPYVPTAAEMNGESWTYCYGQDVVIPPPDDTPSQEESDAHHQ